MRQNLIMLVLILVCMNAYGQVAPNRHSSVDGHAWISCTTTPSPNPSRGNSHWIMYQLDEVKDLFQTQLWNYNHPDNLNRGIKDFVIDISLNGTTWQQVGGGTLDKATASGFYEGEAGPSLNGNQAKYILITALSNYGAPCFALSEVKINIANSPLDVDFVKIKSACDINHKPEIFWEVANEKDIPYYSVQYSKDLTGWAEIGIVKIPMFSPTPLKYSYKDNAYENGVAYYRIKTTDKNGLIDISDITSLKCVSNLNTYSLSPIPAKDHVFLKVQTKGKSDVHYDCYDNAGRMVLSNSFIGNGDEDVKIDISQFPSGLYTFKLSIDGDIFTEKLIISK